MKNLFKIPLTISSTILLSSCLNGQVQVPKKIQAIGCAKTKELALKKAKENLAIKLAPKPKFNLNPGFSSFPVVVDDINLKVEIIKSYKDKEDNICLKVQKR